MRAAGHQNQYRRGEVRPRLRGTESSPRKMKSYRAVLSQLLLPAPSSHPCAEAPGTGGTSTPGGPWLPAMVGGLQAHREMTPCPRPPLGLGSSAGVSSVPEPESPPPPLLPARDLISKPRHPLGGLLSRDAIIHLG